MSEDLSDINLDLSSDGEWGSFLDSFHEHPPSTPPKGKEFPIVRPVVRVKCRPCDRVVKSLARMRDHILKKNCNGTDKDPVNVFPGRRSYTDLKREVRLYRYPDHCRCDEQARFHPQTGKSSILVVALSFAYHTSNMDDISTDHDDIVLQMENNYMNWKDECYSKKPSIDQANKMKKVKRFDAVLEKNRKMYRQ